MHIEQAVRIHVLERLELTDGGWYDACERVAVEAERLECHELRHRVGDGAGEEVGAQVAARRW
jgi:hypothetical protein